MKDDLFLVFDVESVGLHGEGFAFGYVVVNRAGREITAARAACKSERARGDEAGRDWVYANIPESVAVTALDPRDVRSLFWETWLPWRARGALLCADCPWPVEARFLAACVDDDPAARTWEGPYPLLDVASVRFAVDFGPLDTIDRRPDELPVHDPLCDARQSARLLVEALRRLDSWRTLVQGGTLLFSTGCDHASPDR